MSTVLPEAPPEYPPESLRAIAARLRLAAAANMPPPPHEAADEPGFANGSGLVRIKQEILDQSNLSSEDLRAGVADSIPAIQVPNFIYSNPPILSRDQYWSRYIII